MTILVLQAIAGFVLLYFGAEWLVNGSSKLALKLGIAPLIIGLTVVAFGTSSPELFVCLDANLSKEDPNEGGGIVLATIVGSNVFNIALILAIGALIRPIQVSRQIVVREMPILLVATGLLLWFLRDQQLSRVEGGILFGGLIAFLVLSGITSIKQMKEKRGGTSEILEDLNPEATKEMPVWKALVFIVFGLLFLAYGSDLLVDSATEIAKAFHVSAAIISFTLIAFGSSVPELATVVVASLRKEGDIITGNVIGSNIFNTLAVLGIVALVKPVVYGPAQLTTIEPYYMAGLTLLLFPFLLTRKTIARWEGLVLLLACVGFACIIFQKMQVQRAGGPPAAGQVVPISVL